MKNAFKLIIFIILALAPACDTSKPKLKNILCCSKKQSINSDKKHHIFVFVHGTLLPYPSPESLLTSIKKTLQSGRRDKISWNDRFIYELRFKSIYKFQPIQEYGLQKINFSPITPNSPYFYSFISSMLFQNVLNNIDSEKYSDLSFYTFGWDGKLSHVSRVESAKKLYSSLLQKIQILEKKYNKISITILGHSHGGNVALNLANAHNILKSNMVIDNLILLGTPVQSETAQFVLSPIFKKIYNFYSTSDMVQVIDILSTQDSTSKRRFKNVSPLQNLVQIELEVGTKHPAHNELWLFGDSSNWLYRHKLATYPVPLFIFVPTILNLIEKNYPNSNNLLVNIDRNEDNFIIKFNEKNRIKEVKVFNLPTKLIMIPKI